MAPGVLLTIYCGLILLASLAGGWIPLFLRLTHTKMQVATSFVAGLMLGVGVLHLLPHALDHSPAIDWIAGWMLGGFLIMFFIQRFFHFHHHDVSGEEASENPSAEAMVVHEHDHDHDHAQHHHHHHDHDHEESLTLAERSASKLTWTGAALGLTLHTLIDGFALASSVHADSLGTPAPVLLGLGTFLVIILHKPFDAMAIGTLMAAGGSSRLSRHLVNGLFAMAIPLGVLLFHFGAAQFSGEAGRYLGAALAFAAGTFLCIASSDLLPELQFHSHDRVKLSIALLSGLALSVLIGAFETTGHDHQREGSPQTEQMERNLAR
ncbi:MAG: iron permease [Verrucomicrobia bacterium]|nr:iron permease [Verrucomicrobiota bacterium]